MNKSLSDMTVGEVKQLLAQAEEAKQLLSGYGLVKEQTSAPMSRDTRQYEAGSVIRIGNVVFIRTVTMIVLGRIVDLTHEFIELEDASWVAETARYAESLATGALNEVEPYLDNVVVGRGAIIEATMWGHALPREAK